MDWEQAGGEGGGSFEDWRSGGRSGMERASVRFFDSARFGPVAQPDRATVS